mmetsp:Transcript_4688/g.11375  ORF Transcript_4688/g.11375 Transcript_4688/m.11375 type:complete len:221 (-) Transcript_4688:90-752(-)
MSLRSWRSSRCGLRQPEAGGGSEAAGAAVEGVASLVREPRLVRQPLQVQGLEPRWGATLGCRQSHPPTRLRRCDTGCPRTHRLRHPATAAPMTRTRTATGGAATGIATGAEIATAAGTAAAAAGPAVGAGTGTGTGAAAAAARGRGPVGEARTTAATRPAAEGSRIAGIFGVQFWTAAPNHPCDTAPFGWCDGNLVSDLNCGRAVAELSFVAVITGCPTM